MKKIRSSNYVILAVTIIVTLILAFIINYFLLPARNIHSSGFWWYCILIGIIAIIISKIAHTINNKGKGNYDKPFVETHVISVAFGAITAVGLVIFFITSISSWKIFHANDYANLIQVEEGDFESDIPEISDTAVIVDMKTAQKLGDRTIGTIQNASWYEADDEYNLISVNGEFYRISSIKYAGFFEYIKANSSGIPGFILVNAETQEAEYVELENGMKYAPSAYWGYDLTRHLHNQYPSYILGKSFFEIDDNYNPYWITNVRTAKIGLRGAPVATSLLITNAITGETTEYSMSEIPDWVDHVNSVEYLMDLIKCHYRYQDGWWNPSNTNVFRTSYYYKDDKEDDDENKYTPFEGYNSMVDNDGNIWFYTGLTPANSAETNVGFLLISPKTGEVRYYAGSGAEESSAQIAAEGLVQDLKYSASFPNMINVDGIPTYFMVLKDSAGLVQRYALCNVEQYSKVVQAETLSEALSEYRRKMELTENVDENNETSDTLGDVSVTEQHKTVRTSGKVQTLTEAQINGYTYYYFMLENDENIYMSSIENSNLQPLKLIAGAEVEIEHYSEEDVEFVTSITFK